MREVIPLLKVSSEKAEAIVHIISELVRNVIEHAASPLGAIVCAQYYKKSNSIRIGIADTGIGVKEAIGRSHPAETHFKAINLALTPGITGTTSKIGGTDQNAGFGLFLIKSIAYVNRDFFVMYSGSGFYKLLKRAEGSRIKLNADPFDDRHSKDEKFPSWGGTIVGIDMSLDQTEEFSRLLKAIGEIYRITVKEKRKAFYKRRAQFI